MPSSIGGGGINGASLMLDESFGDDRGATPRDAEASFLAVSCAAPTDGCTVVDSEASPAQSRSTVVAGTSPSCESRAITEAGDAGDAGDAGAAGGAGNAGGANDGRGEPNAGAGATPGWVGKCGPGGGAGGAGASPGCVPVTSAGASPGCVPVGTVVLDESAGTGCPPDGGIVEPGRRTGGTGDALPAGRFGSWIPVGGALRGPRRGGNGGNRRPHA